MADTSQVVIVFWILAAVTLLSGLLVVSLKNIFHCAMFLIKIKLAASSDNFIWLNF